MSKETSHKSYLIGRKSPLVLYWKVDFFEVYKRCRAHLRTLHTYGVESTAIKLQFKVQLHCCKMSQNVATLILPAQSKPLYLMLLPLFCLEMSLAESRGSSFLASAH